MSEALRELSGHIETHQGDAVLETAITGGELTITVVPSSLAKFLAFLREDKTCNFGTLVDITAVDWPGRDKRFDVVYHLLSMYQNHRIRVKAGVREKEIVPSITGVYKSADWYEREIFDMFGILFSGHPDLRRILTDYGFRGYPLRKDFPTTGYTEVRYDETAKRVVYEPVSLVQDYRTFDLMSPWEGADYILPGDEKAEDAPKG
ncbi:NADH-quinone oxidoreductase subunit C [Roseobacter sp. HKCCA0434]|uniref:NADH-quinone oxidoreductase subunit C n=1 Tax=Roseobacter sp. HKCCA0434 TaxID=3079297 RepID=UPI002905E0FD|nr:NADH-quinone oxidoreductase subunit C [Roseobacter sp. HKCCA0434]